MNHTLLSWPMVPAMRNLFLAKHIRTSVVNAFHAPNSINPLAYSFACCHAILYHSYNMQMGQGLLIMSKDNGKVVMCGMTFLWLADRIIILA